MIAVIWPNARFWWLCVGAFCLSLAGCGSPNLPKTVPVCGKVTWQGKPLASGSVVFNPAAVAASGPSRAATAELASDGTYRLSSFRPDDGVMPGEYRVTIVSFSSPPNPEQGKTGVWRIPTRYGDPEKSGLSFTIPSEARGPFTYDIDLK